MSTAVSSFQAPLLATIDGDLHLNDLRSNFAVTFAPGVRVSRDLRVENSTAATTVALTVAEVGRAVTLIDNANLGGSLTVGQLGDPIDGQDLNVYGNDGLTMAISVDHAARRHDRRLPERRRRKHRHLAVQPPGRHSRPRCAPRRKRGFHRLRGDDLGERDHGRPLSHCERQCGQWVARLLRPGC